MYKTIITIIDTIPQETLDKIKAVVAELFCNRAGTVKNSSLTPNVLVFEGGEESYGCLSLGVLALEKKKKLLPFVKAWRWEEDDFNECCDMLEVIATPVGC